MQLAHLLFTQGFGTRRVCAGMVQAGMVSIAGRVVDDPGFEVEPEGLEFEVEGRSWPYQAQALVMLHKPAGYECSQKPKHHPGVLTLLPPPLRERGVQPVGRLDEDTTGLLLLTDDGALIHRLTSPKKHVPKVYEVTAKHPVEPVQLEQLRAGVVLVDDPRPTRIAAVEAIDEHRLRLTITEGRYHQVKRMIAAVGNRCEALHRVSMGGLTLPADLPAGGWRFVDAAGRAALLGGPTPEGSR